MCVEISHPIAPSASALSSKVRLSEAVKARKENRKVYDARERLRRCLVDPMRSAGSPTGATVCAGIMTHAAGCYVVIRWACNSNSRNSVLLPPHTMTSWQALLKEQPADPTSFLCTHLRGAEAAPSRWHFVMPLSVRRYPWLS